MRWRPGSLKLSETYKQDELRTLPAIRLESLARHWMFYDTQLAEWRGQLQRVTADYSEAAAELASRRAAWEADPRNRRRPAAGPGRAASTRSSRRSRSPNRPCRHPLDDQLNLARRGNCGAAGRSIQA